MSCFLLVGKYNEKEFVFAKERVGKGFIYYAQKCSEDGKVKLGGLIQVNKEWIYNHKNDILNVGIGTNGSLYHIKGGKTSQSNSNKKTTVTLSYYENAFWLSNKKLRVVYLIQDGVLSNITKSLKLKDDKIKIVLDKPIEKREFDSSADRDNEILYGAEGIFIIDGDELYFRDTWLNLDKGKFVIENDSRSIFDTDYLREGYKVYTSSKLPLKIAYNIFSTEYLTCVTDGSGRYSVATLLRDICEKFTQKIYVYRVDNNTYEDYTKDIKDHFSVVPKALKLLDKVGEFVKTYSVEDLEKDFKSLKIKTINSKDLFEIKKAIAYRISKRLGIIDLYEKSALL